MYAYRQVKRDGRHLGEHRFFMERHLGRQLGRFEFVHHINGDKRDNRLENLKVVSPKEHAAEHNWQIHPLTKVCENCGVEFKPAPTKRKRAKACSRFCGQKLSSKKQRKPTGHRSKYRSDAYPSEIARRK